jgi:hypothetical protein
MIRSRFALIATLWFAFNAIALLPTSGAYLNGRALGGIDGDPAAVAVTWAARALFAGLALLALSMLDWDWLGRAMRSLTAPVAAEPGDLRDQ